MRRIVGAAFVTLDGVMQGPGGANEDTTGGFRFSGWLPPVGDEAIEAKIGELFGRPFDLLLGRRTYEIFAAYWPYAPDEMAQIRDPFDACTKYVVTHGNQPLEWRNSQRVDGIEALRAIKQSEGPDLVIQGSSVLYPQLLEAGLLDELTLMISPVVLGEGKRMFGDGTPPRTLEMTGHQVSDRGNIIVTYQPAGPVALGSYVTGEPSEREKLRQAEMADGSW
ncbi:dihydrofolate reductase family protein [Sphingomonas mesophila]|uniref:dihydrofolate reductase family protein n=1 Tax=Sphingomonas mesophila TaxID=2303576 RepID=UPI000E580C14|nr:dihydrofolate reductase family protein [Sphingomonas mesophila]